MTKKSQRKPVSGEPGIRARPLQNETGEVSVAPPQRSRQKKSGTGAPLHTKEPVTVASFRTWRGWRENVARNRCLTLHLSKRSPKTGMDYFELKRMGS